MMKRFMYPFLTIALIFSLNACGQTETKKDRNQNSQAATEKMTEAQTEEMVQIANPWASYDTLEDAEKAAGFSFTFGKSLYTGVYKADTFTVIDGQMMDVTYLAEGTEDMITIRQTKESAEDISGDYNEYSHDFTVSDCGIEDIHLRGTKDHLFVTDFTYEGYTYVIYSDEGDYNEIFAIIGEMTGKDPEVYKALTNADDSSEELNEEGAYILEEGRLIDEEPIELSSLSGLYNGIEYDECELTVYSSVEEESNFVGNIIIMDHTGATVYEGELIKVMDNLYEIYGSDVNLSVYSDNGNFGFELYDGHEHADYFVMTSPYLP